MSTFAARGHTHHHHRHHHHGDARDRTPAADAGKSIAANLDRCEHAVTAAVDAMTIAASNGDREAWRTARTRAERAIDQIRGSAEAARGAAAGERDPAVAARLAEVDELVRRMTGFVEIAPDEPAVAVPALGCEADLAAALPPLGAVANTREVFGAAEHATARVFAAMTFTDVRTFCDLVRDRPEHELVRRFRRFDAARRERLLGMLKDSKRRAIARAREPSPLASPTNVGRAAPPEAVRSEIDPPAVFDENRATIDDGAEARAERDARANIAETRARGEAVTTDPPPVFDENRATIDDSAAGRAERDAYARIAETRARGEAVTTDPPPVFDEAVEVHRKPAGAGGIAASADDAVAAARRDGGRPLDAATRGRLEDTVGGDLSSVRLHDGAAAATAADTLGARAFTVGQDIHLGRGEGGDELLAHEATHALQQQGAPAAGSGLAIAAEDSAEERAADQAARGVAVELGQTRQQIAMHRHPHKKAAEPDWEVGGPAPADAEHFEPIVVVDPDVESATVLLGDTFKQKLSFGNAHAAPKHVTFDWEQTIDGPATEKPEVSGVDGHKGTHATMKFAPRTVGERDITTRVWKTQADGQTTHAEGPPLHLEVPKPTVADVQLSSISADKALGRRPVLDQMLADEDLVVRVTYDDLGKKLADVDLEVVPEGFTLKKAPHRVGPGTFELVLTPQKTGELHGDIVLRALERTFPAAAFEIKTLPRTVDDDGNTDPNDTGPQPVSFGNATGQIKDAWNSMYGERDRAVTAVYEQSKEKDPPPAPSIWDSVLEGALDVALAAFAGGFAEVVAGYVAEKMFSAALKHHEILADGVQEFVKMFVEDGTNKVREKVVGGGKGEGTSGGEGEAGSSDKRKKQDNANPGGTKLTLGSVFLHQEGKGLDQAHRSQLNRAYNTLVSKLTKMEDNEPGSGFRLAMALGAGVDAAVADDTFYWQQYTKSFDAYLNLMAKNQLGTDPPEGKTEGTDLKEVVEAGAQNLAEHEVPKPDPLVTSYAGGDGPEKVAGVLRLDLSSKSTYTDGWGGDLDEHRALSIKRASLHGVTSAEFAAQISTQPLKSIPINVLAVLDHGESGFVIGRNEAGQYWAAERDSTDLEWYGKTGEEAARAILEDVLGDKPVGDVKIDH